MSEPATNDPVELMSDEGVQAALESALEAANAEGLSELLEAMPAHDALRHITHLSDADRGRVVALISPEAAARLVEEAPDELAAALIEDLDSPVAAKILEELHSDTQADIVQELDESSADAILLRMDPDEAAGVRRLVQYEPHTAGGLMVWELFSFRATERVADVLKRLSEEDDDFERYRGQHPYILDADGHLAGVVSLRGLLTSRRSATLADIMTAPLSVKPEDPVDSLVDLFEAHPFLGVPVVDANGMPLGVVSRAAVADAALARAERDAMAMQRSSDELRSMPTWLRARRRLAWLSSNIVLNIIAASVISAYEETLAAVIAIAVFLPMVSDMSGCSGNQAVGVSMRELALGLARPADVFRVWRKEVTVGLINGVVLGILIGLVAWVWKGNAYLGLVIGLALAMNTVLAVSIGGTVPLMLKRLGVDPAVASGPLLTTVTDMAGFFLVLSLASALMPQLLG